MSVQIDPSSEVARARSVDSGGIAKGPRIGDWRAITRTSRFAYAAIFVTALIIFGAMCARDITGEDAGELVTAAATFGVAHPPGYPLWTVLGKIFSVVIPFGTIAFRVAFMSAFFGAATAVTIAALVRRLVPSWPAAVLAAFSFAFLRDQWTQTTIAEVYTLGTFLFAAMFLALVAWSQTLADRHFIAFTALLGLSVSNHLTALAIGPGALLFALIHDWRFILRWRLLLKSAGVLLLGLLPYAYLPLAARQAPDFNWGDPSNWSRFVEHVTRSQYTNAATPAPRSYDRFNEQIDVFKEHMGGQGATIAFVLGGIGFFCMLFYRRDLLALLAPTALLSTIGIILYTNFGLDHENRYVNRLFFVPAYLTFMIAAAWFVGGFLRVFGDRAHRTVGFAAAALCAGFPFLANYTAADYSRSTLVRDYGRALVLTLEKDAIVFPSSDHNSFPLVYFRFVEELRPDVTVADKYGYIDDAVYANSPFASLPESERRSKGFRLAVEDWIVKTTTRPVYFSSKRGFSAETQAEMVSEGLWYRARKRGVTAETIRAADREAWSKIPISIFVPDSGPYDYTARVLLADVAFARARRAFALGEIDEGKRLSKEAVGYSKESKETFNNLGSLLAEYRCWDEALTMFQSARALDSTYVTARRNAGICLRAAGRHDEAWNEFVGLFFQDESDPIANRELGQMARERQRWPEAVYFLARHGKATQDAKALRDAGLIAFYELGDPRAAKDLLRASLEIDPNQKEIKDLAEQLAQGGEGTADAAAEAFRKPNQTSGRYNFNPAPKSPFVPEPEKLLMPTPKLPTGAPTGPAQPKTNQPQVPGRRP